MTASCRSIGSVEDDGFDLFRTWAGDVAVCAA